MGPQRLLWSINGPLVGKRRESRRGVCCDVFASMVAISRLLNHSSVDKFWSCWWSVELTALARQPIKTR